MGKEYWYPVADVPLSNETMFEAKHSQFCPDASLKFHQEELSAFSRLPKH